MTKRRILAILLSLLLLVQALPTSALAATLYSNVARGASYPTVKFVLASSVDAEGNLVYGTTVEQLVEAGGTAVVPDVPNVDGYKFTGWSPAIPDTINVDTTFTAQYSPISVYTVNVKYVFADNSSAAEALSYDYEDNGKENTLYIAVPAMTGFTPSVKDENGNAVAIEGEEFKATFSGAKTYTVTYEGADVNYTVKHHLQNVDNAEYTENEDVSDTLSGEAGTLTAGVAKTFEGFTAPATIEQKNINPDGSTVVDIYYTRNTYKLTYATGVGATYVDNEVVPYGATVNLPTVSRDGYTFDGWKVTVGGVEQQDYAKDVESFIMPAGDVELTAKWTANVEASYTVIYWQQSKSDKHDTTTKTYDYVCTKVRTGNVGDQTTYDRLNSSELYDYDYSTLNTAASVNKTIEADGSTVVNVYYDRVVMTLTFLYDEKTYKTLKGLYGQSFAQAGVSWPFEYKWNITSGRDSSTMTFMNAFVKQSMDFNGDEDYEYVFTGSDPNTIELKHYLQNVDGTWPSEPELTCYAGGGNLTLNNKFEGFTVAYFRHTSGCGWNCAYSDHEWHAGSASSGAGSTSHLIEVRHTRNKYVLSFENCNDAIAAVTLPYQQKLSEGKPAEPADFAAWRPSNVDDDYSFDGWYLDEACQQPVDWTKLMPSHNMQVFAKWKAPEKTVKYHLNYTDAEDPYKEYTVLKYETLNENSVTLPSDPTREGYNFEGWYTDSACTKPLVADFGNVQIAKDWNIYAKWVSTEEKETTTSLVTTTNVKINSYIDENGVEQPISTIDMPTASGTVGETVTLEAPDIPGYVPVSKFVTHVIKDDSEDPDANVVEIKYTKLDTWMLTVNYVDAEGNSIAKSDSYANLTATTKAVVYKVIPGGTENGKKYIWQATSYVQTGAKANAKVNANEVLEATVTFVYKKVYEAEYEIKHYQEQLDGSYELVATDKKVGWTGYTATAGSADAKDYSANNLEYNPDNTNNVLSVTIGAKDAEGNPVPLKLYYELQVADYTVKHLKQNVDGSGYTEVEEDREVIKNGKIGDKTAAEANTYTGFTAQPFEQKTITADGKTVVEIKYNRNTYDYVIHHVEKDNVANVLAADTTGKAVFGATVTVADYKKTIEGFAYDSNSGNITIAVEGNEATIYYSRNSYEVSYAYTGNVPDAAPAAPATVSKNYGEEVTVEAAPAVDGFAFSGWTTDDASVADGKFTMPAGKVELTGSFSRDFENYDFAVAPYEGQYDADAHGVIVSGLYEGDVVEYATEADGEWTSELKYTDVGVYSVFVRVSNAIGNVVSEVKKSSVTITAIELILNKEDTKKYNGADQTIEITNSDIVSGALVSGETLTISGATITGKNVGDYTDVADYTWSVTKADGTNDSTDNYTINVSGKLTITQYDDEVTVTIVGNHATDVYDGEPHTVTGYEVTAISTELYTADDFTFTGTASASRTEEGTTYMGLKAEQFANTNGNFKTVTFNATDGYQTITPVDEVVVTITGKTSTVDYDGAEHTATGYDVEISNPLYTVNDFTFSGTASASRIDAGKTEMGLAKDQFANTNGNFATVTFNVTDGYQEILPIDVTVTIVGANNTTKYDGEAHTVTGYTATASTDLYDVTKDFTFSGTAEATRTDVGTTNMGLKAEQFKNTNGNFKTVTFEVTDGYQTIEPIDVTVTIVGANNTTKYDGKEHKVEGYTATANTELYDVENDFTFSGNAVATRTDVGTTNMGLAEEQFANTNGNFATVTFNVTDGYQTIEPLKGVVVTITENSGEEDYDGTEKTVTGYTAKASSNLYDVTKDFTFTGNDSVSGINADAYDMELKPEDFENKNSNFADVTFVIKDGQLVIKPIDVTVTIVGANNTSVYDGTEHKVEGYTATANNDLYDVTKDFTFSGNAVAARTEEGTTNMGLAADQFKNTNGNFATVTFNVTDGYQTITPVDVVVVTIVGNTATNEYDGNEHKITGYTATANNDLYDVTKDFTFSGTAEAARTEVGTTYMGLVDTQFANTNGNFSKVTFVVTDGYQTITPVDDEVVVTIVGKNNTAAYDGAEHTVTGYDVTEISNSLYKEADFVFNGTAEAKRTDAGTTNMGLAADQFENTNDNFANVTFNVIDGYQTITPIDVTVTIVGANNTTEYDGVEHEVSGYTATANTELYDVTKDFTFSGTAVAARTDVGQTDMSLAADQFANTNSNFATVTFEVTDGYQKITPVAEEVVVTIVGKNNTTDYDGTEHGVNGYDVTNISNELYTAADFSFSGTAEAKRTDAGQTDMGLNAEQFSNTNTNFSKVTFQVTDGYQKINPIDVIVTIVGKNATNVYDGAEHKVEGYTATADTKLYDVTKDFTFSGNAVAARTEEGTTNMGLKAEQFANTNGNFATVTFNVTDGYQTITPMTDEVVVTIVGNNVTKTYDGVEYVASGYEVTNISNSLYTEADFVFNGTAEAKRTDVGTTEMGLAAEQFKNTSADFANVKFVVTDGYVTINPRPITVIAASDEKVYDATALTNGNYLVLDGTYAAAPESATFDQDGETIVKKITATVSGSQTLVGESANTVATVTIDGTQYAATAEKFGNYAVTFIAGILAVTDEGADEDLVVNKTHEDKEYALGETVTFTITVKNIYAEAKTITITEKAGVTLVGGTDGKLVIEDVAPGAEVTATATYVITSDDILAGTFVNEVEVSFDGGSTFGDEDPVDPEKLDTTLTVEKTSDTEGKPVVLDQVITYTIKVTNDGNVPFYNVKVTDEWTKDNWTIAELKVGETKEFTTTYTVTSDDILAGKVVNEVVAKGNPVKDPEGGEKTPEGKDDVTDTSDELDTTLDVEKTSDKEGQKVELGEKITYTITVTNKGNVPFYNVKVVDKLVGLEETIAELAVGATETFTATYTVTSDDILAGEVINSVTATADPVKDPDGEDKVPTDEDTITDEPGNLNTALEVVKTSDVAEGETVSLGDTITYTIKVTNKGNVPFYNVVVKDAMVDFEKTIAELAVGATETFTVTYVVTSDDIKAGEIVNAVTAEGDPIDDPKNPDDPKKPEGGDDEKDPTDDLNTTLEVVKTSDVAEGETVSLGDTITYTIKVTNKGNVPFTNVKVTDEWTGDSWTIAELAVGATETFTATHVVTSDDILAGKVVNEVVAEADKIPDPNDPENPKKPGGNDDVEDETDDLNTTLEVVKTTISTPANGETYALNETIKYEITVTNKGNVPFTNVIVTDELTGDSWTIAELAVGATETFTAEYTVVEDDIKAGSVINEVVAKGDEIDDPKKPDEPKKPEGEDDVEDPTDKPNPAYTVVKVRTDEPANGEFYELGEEVEFEITVTNTGNVTLKGIVVKEELEGAIFENGTDEMTIETLPPFTKTEGENVVKFTATYVITEDDLGNDDLANTLSAKDSDDNEPDPIKPEPIPVDDVTTVTVAKVWDDLNNKYNTRTAVTVNLLADEEAYTRPGEEAPATAVIAEDEDGNWNSVTFEKLPVHKNGEEIVYTVEEVAVPGYDATYANDGNSWTITNTLQQYTLTIRHWIHFVDGEVAAPNYERTVYYGESYSVRSPNVKGFWPNPRYTTGIVTGNMVHDVIYDELDFTLTVQYVYQNGATAAPTHVQKKLHYGDDYRVVSPKLEGYVASYPEISGYMGTRDLSFTVIYVPENTIIIDEYGVPLGLGNVEMNVGECFE